MSGHSHARTVKAKKEGDAKKRSKIFSKLARLITVAAKDGGPNPDMNSKLRMAIDNARTYNMPNDNIERAIKKASGKGEREQLEEFLYEAYGPAGTALLIEGITDNKKRALAEIKKIVTQHNGKLVSEGAVKWMFERKGLIIIDLDSQPEELKNKEELELIIIEAGAEDMFWKENSLEVYSSVENLGNMKKSLEEKNIKIETNTLEWKPKEEVEISEKDMTSSQKLFNALDEADDVQDIYSNIKL
jgi:YebC/PmpR family DNA-binding regulatory protein